MNFRPRARSAARWFRLCLPLLLSACIHARPPAPAPGADEGVKRVRIVHTNDLHGRLLPQQPAWAKGRPVGGAAVLAAHFDSAAARFGGPIILLSGGDDMQGTAISNLSWGRATIATFNAMGYDAAALGNHEFDWGQDTLRARIRESRFPWLAANLFREGTRQHPEWARPWVMLERGGARTAIIGIALTASPDYVMAGRLAGLHFAPEAAEIDRAVREVRAAGADFVVVTMHVGAVCEEPGEAPEEESRGCRGEMVEVAAALQEPVDLIVGGHTHARVMTTASGIPVVEAASYSEKYSITDLERRNGQVRVVHREVRTSFADEVDPDTAVARVVGEWEAQVRPISERVVVRFAHAMPKEDVEFRLGNLIADAFRTQLGAQVSLVNAGSVRRAMPAGQITYGMLYELQPFQNELLVLELRGADLRAALENSVRRDGKIDAQISGMTVTYDPDAASGSRVREIRLADGRLVDADTRVTVAVTEFMASGGDRYASLLQGQRRRTGQVDVNALIAYLEALPQPVTAPPTGRWRPLR